MFKKISDEKLVNQVIKNPDYFREIIKRYQTKLEKYVFYLIGQKEEIDDIVQQVFIKTYINLKGFDQKRRFSSWLFRIAHNETVNFLKKQKKLVSFNDNLSIKDEKDIEVDLEKKDLVKTLKNCLSEIPISYREIITLYYFNNLSYQEISEALKVPEGTVAIRLFRAKAYLKKLCQKKI